MNLLNSDFKKGRVKLRITETEDLWYLSHLIDPGDVVTGKTTRKIKIGDGENAKMTKVTLTLTIEVETAELNETNTALRVHGRVKEGPEDVPRDSHHTITIEGGSEFTLEKVQWLAYQKQKLEEATAQRYTYLVCLFDREEAFIALTKAKGFEVLAHLQGEAVKKRHAQQINKDFWDELIKALDVYGARYAPERIILASPAFYKEDLFKRITNPELKRSIVLAIASDVSEPALHEVLKRPELAQILQHSRMREEELLMEELLKEVQKEGLAVYGWEEVTKAAQAGAIGKLLVTDAFLLSRKQHRSFLEVDELMRHCDGLQAEIHLISIDHEGGKRLQGLGGIAALLRYKLEW